MEYDWIRLTWYSQASGCTLVANFLESDEASTLGSQDVRLGLANAIFHFEKYNQTMEKDRKARVTGVPNGCIVDVNDRMHGL